VGSICVWEGNVTLRENLPRQLDGKNQLDAENKNEFVAIVQRLGKAIKVIPRRKKRELPREAKEYGGGSVAPTDDYLASWALFRAFNCAKSEGAAQWWDELETQSVLQFGSARRYEIVWALFTIWRGNSWAEATAKARMIGPAPTSRRGRPRGTSAGVLELEACVLTFLRIFARSGGDPTPRLKNSSSEPVNACARYLCLLADVLPPELRGRAKNSFIRYSRLVASGLSGRQYSDGVIVLKNVSRVDLDGIAPLAVFKIHAQGDRPVERYWQNRLRDGDVVRLPSRSASAQGAIIPVPRDHLKSSISMRPHFTSQRSSTRGHHAS
jgi:hypothetical protein